MTQEELDALIAGDIPADIQENQEPSHHHDMAEQLGSVTKESEVKATEIFDKLESILEVTGRLKDSPKNVEEELLLIENIVMDIMSTMQYQDIHRQKIERVINNMRSISKLMNQTLNIVDEDIAPSAKHIAGDATSDLVSDEELEALIASMK
jgi:chemotaxis regulatin CheY-phosphate phosphatase CheZ